MQIHSNRFLLTIVIDENKNIAICHSDYNCKDLIKASGFKWNQVKKYWYIELNFFRDNLDLFHKRFGLCSVSCDEFITGKKYKPPVPKKNEKTYTALDRLKLRPYGYQCDGINFATENPYCIIGDEMGLGKTPQAIGVLAAHAAPSLVICPASLKYNWQAELEKFCGIASFIIEGNTNFTAKKNQWAIELIMNDWPIVFIVNYEIIRKYEIFFRHCKHWVIDEAHALKNPDAERTKTFYKYLLEWKPKTATFLTGTAITNNVADFYSLLDFCSHSPKENGLRISDNPKWSSWFRFAQYFCHSRQTDFGTKYSGLKNWPDLREIMAHKYIRRSAQDYLPDLPPLTRSIFTCKPDEKLLHSIDEGLSIALQILRNGGKFDPETDVAISTAKKGAAALKTPFTAEIAISLISEGEKVIIFSDHIDACQDIKNRIGKTCWLITSATTQKVRQHTCECFQDKTNTDCQAIVATYGTMNAGRTLTAARITIANDLPWIPATYLQAEKRFHRIGQTEKCLVKIISAPGLDTMINKTILDKALTLTQVLSYGHEKVLEWN